MTLIVNNGKKNISDMSQQRIGNGTVGTTHVAPGSLTGSQISNIVAPEDSRIQYDGAWSLNVGGMADDFLGQSAMSLGGGGDTLSFTFTGTRLTIIGSNVSNGGYADIFIDGELQGGRINTYTFLGAANGIQGINASVTTIPVNFAGTTDFVSSGFIQIDNEIITYTGIESGITIGGVTCDAFIGCVRGANHTLPSTHETGAMVFAYSSVINFYSPFKQARIPVWSNTALSPGTHVITIISTSIVPPGSSQAGIIYFSGFIVNGLIGAANVSTLLDFAKFSVFFGGAGFSLVPWVPTPTSLNRQIIGIYGCAAYAIGTTSPLIPCFYSYNPVSGAMTFYCPSSPSTSLDVVVTFTVLGPTI